MIKFLEKRLGSEQMDLLFIGSAMAIVFISSPKWNLFERRD